MGKTTGFMEYERQTPPDLPVEKRIQGWAEFHTHFDGPALETQCARCMNCGVPFCHTGYGPDEGSVGCPLGNLIPEWNDLVYQGQYELAYKRLMKTNNFPEFTGRVCPAPCEGSCTLGSILPPVAIKNTEMHIIDTMFSQGKVQPRIPKNRTGKTVAVIGSGPSGLACSDILNQLGHQVTVFERADRPGGLLMYGIPNMKLEKDVVLRRAAILEQEGVMIKTGVAVGKDLPWDIVASQYDAVVLCCGATKPRALAVEGKDLQGVYFAVDFLKAATQSLLDSSLADGRYVDCKDKHVVIVGGGDTGTDCVATSIRLGCKSVIQLEIMPELPSDRTDANPWPYFPRVKKTDYGQEEAISIFGADPRQYCTTVKKVVGTQGHVTGVQIVEGTWQKEGGRMVFIEDETTLREIPADLVITAMGFTGAEESNMALVSQRPSPGVMEFSAGEEHIFLAGDMRRGQSLVVWAISEGRKAAEQCHRYLME